MEKAIKKYWPVFLVPTYECDYEPCHFSMEEGYDAMVRLIMRSPDLTAVFALGDAIALGAMRAVFDMGLSIPGDLSLVGFDGVNSSQFSIPRLTTIRQETPSSSRCGAWKRFWLVWAARPSPCVRWSRSSCSSARACGRFRQKIVPVPHPPQMVATMRPMPLRRRSAFPPAALPRRQKRDGPVRGRPGFRLVKGGE